jgi:hypothetical protein
VTLLLHQEEQSVCLIGSVWASSFHDQ